MSINLKYKAGIFATSALTSFFTFAANAGESTEKLVASVATGAVTTVAANIAQIIASNLTDLYDKRLMAEAFRNHPRGQKPQIQYLGAAILTLTAVMASSIGGHKLTRNYLEKILKERSAAKIQLSVPQSTAPR